MHLTLIKNTDDSKILLYKIARLIYAETGATSLAAVEALASMIANICLTSQRELDDIVTDKQIFSSLDRKSSRHDLLLVDAQSRQFQMCLRVVQRMLNGDLADSCCGATRFHHVDVLPGWAVSRGYVAEIDGLLFYL